MQSPRIIQVDTKSSKLDLKALRRKSVSGGYHTIFARFATIFIQLTSTIILARLLTPEDYGIMAMAMTLSIFAGMFRDFGLSFASIQKNNLTLAQQSSLFWINVMVGLTLAALMVAASPLIARFYAKPELVPIVCAMSLSMIFASCGAQHSASLVREMRFARQAFSNVFGAFVNLVVAVCLAASGYSYWALVIGLLTGNLVTTVALFFLSSFNPGKPARFAEMISLLRFGANVTGFNIINYFHRNSDNILIGKFYGAGQLGFYSRAYTLLMLPVQSLRGPIESVGYSAMCRLSDHPAEYRNYYRKMVKLLALASMPVSSLMYLAADPIVKIALGDQWLGVIPIFSILALVAFVQPVITLWGIVLLSCGLSGRYFVVGCINTVVSLLGFGVGLPWGASGVATGYAIATYLSAYPILKYALAPTPLEIGDFFKSCLPPFAACLSSVVVTKSLLLLYPAGWLPLLEIVLCGFVFVVVFLISLRVTPGGRDCFQLIHNILPQRVANRFGKFITW